MSSPFLPALAVLAGLLSFSSPCCLPLVPGYLSYVTALPVSELGRRDARSVALRSSVLFVAGFTTVFTLLGLSATLAGGYLLQHRDGLVRLSGIGIVCLGLVTLGVLRVPFLGGEHRVALTRMPKGPAWAFPLGMAFAAGWTPCLGPVLGSVLTLAATTGTVAQGAGLLLAYSLGLGAPFVLLAVGFTRAQQSFRWLRRQGQRVERVSGALLVAVGLLYLTGRWDDLFRPLQRWLAGTGWPPI